MEEEIEKLVRASICEENFRKTRENGLFLSDNQVQILERNHILWKKCSNLKELIFEVEERLSENDDEQLEKLSEELAEHDYYFNTKK